MAIKFRIKRGLKVDLPTLAEGELGLCTDTQEVFIGTKNGNVPFATKQELEALEAKIDSIVISGGGTVVKDSVTNGYINVNGQEIQVYNDYDVTTDITNLKTSQHSHVNKAALDRLNINTQNHLTIDGVELPTGGAGGSSVSDSLTNGNILINGNEVNIYDDTAISNRINSIENSEVLTRLGVSTNGKLTIDGVEVTIDDPTSPIDGGNFTSTYNTTIVDGGEF